MILITQNLEGGPSLKCTLDNLVYYAENVSKIAWENLTKELDSGEYQTLLPTVYRTIGKGASEYHHNLHIGRGAGAVMVSWKHNSERELQPFYRMRVEFNPAKQTKMNEWFWQTLIRRISQYTKRIKQMDIAFDVPTHVGNISAISLTGKDRSYFKNTLYFGSSGKSGRLKIYDKKTELEEVQGITIEENDLTRIEYTKKYDEPIHLKHLESLENLDMNKEYIISNFNLGKNQGVVKSGVLAIQNKEMEMKEFSQAYKVKIKKAFADMEKFDLDHEYRNAKQQILDVIKLYLE
jgi:hypothetical protein